MSYGHKHPEYSPVREEMLPEICEQYPEVSLTELVELYQIWTRNLYTEIIAFVALISMIHRFRSGLRDEGPAYRRYGTGFILSAIRKDKRGKMQTDGMEILHDALVELYMANEAMTDFRRWLLKHNLAFVSIHSCGSAIIHEGSRDLYLSEARGEQKLRTMLDWHGDTQRHTPLPQLLIDCEYEEEEAAELQKCLDLSRRLISRYPERNADPVVDARAAA